MHLFNIRLIQKTSINYTKITRKIIKVEWTKTTRRNAIILSILFSSIVFNFSLFWKRWKQPAQATRSAKLTDLYRIFSKAIVRCAFKTLGKCYLNNSIYAIHSSSGTINSFSLVFATLFWIQITWFETFDEEEKKPKLKIQIIVITCTVWHFDTVFKHNEYVNLLSIIIIIII